MLMILNHILTNYVVNIVYELLYLFSISMHFSDIDNFIKLHWFSPILHFALNIMFIGE